MDTRESHKYMKWCNDRGITIYPKPVVSDGSKCRIALNIRGKEKVGSEIYELLPYKKKVELKTPSGIKEELIIVPGLYDRIRTLYRDTYNENIACY